MGKGLSCRKRKFPSNAALVGGGSGAIGRGIFEALARQGSAIDILYRSNIRGAEAAVAGPRELGADAAARAVDI